MKIAKEIADMIMDAVEYGMVLTRGNLELNIAAKLEPIKEGLDKAIKEWECCDVIAGVNEVIGLLEE